MITSTKYTVQLSNVKAMCDDGKVTSELDVILRVWQDLNRLSIMGEQSGQRLAPEDKLIKKILEQILIAEHGAIPEGYEPVRQDVTEEEAKAMGIQLPNMGQTQAVETKWFDDNGNELAVGQTQAEINEQLGSDKFVDTMTVDEVNEKHKEDNPIYVAPANVGEREDRHLI
tara:strand:+ start:161 stop:673 length:513 start_codon:yes stop_codon:yes gene_type:complete